MNPQLKGYLQTINMKSNALINIIDRLQGSSDINHKFQDLFELNEEIVSVNEMVSKSIRSQGGINIDLDSYVITPKNINRDNNLAECNF